jgi:hypothetical protein
VGQISNRMQESASEAAKGYREYQRIVLSAAQANVNVLFEYAHDAVRAQSVSELIEISAGHSRRRFEKMAGQIREIATAAQKLATETARPLHSHP